jgi:hypothetical protein
LFVVRRKKAILKTEAKTVLTHERPLFVHLAATLGGGFQSNQSGSQSDHSTRRQGRQKRI